MNARPLQRSGATAAVDLYWIPLGAGGHSVGFNGRVFEAIAAAREHRRRSDRYHAALIVELDANRYTIELAPAWGRDREHRGSPARAPSGAGISGGGDCSDTSCAAGAGARSRICATPSAGPTR